MDFITPVVDDPYWFGQIAAANALSDVYAMGGKPLTALNLVMFPSDTADPGLLKDILKGGGDKVEEAGASVAGGHSVEDCEPKYGLAVTGIVHPDKILTNCGAREGDSLVLTKPLGTGVLFNACRSGTLPWRDLEPLLTEIASLNGTALETALNYDIHACTDITGFGLLGHLLEMSKGSKKGMRIFYDNLPLYANAEEMYQKGEITRRNKDNHALVEEFLQIDVALRADQEELLFDPQTSGGLLFSLPASDAGELVSRLKESGIESAAVVGEVSSGETPGISIV